MMLLIAATLAAAAPDAAVTCPQEDSAPALICRALAAHGQGQPRAAAERFEAAAALMDERDPQRLG